MGHYGTALLIVFVIGAVIYQKSFDVKDMVKETNEKLKPPVQISPDVRLDSLSLSGKEILFKYTLSIEQSNIPIEAENMVQKIAKEAFCKTNTNREFDMLIEEQISLKMNFYNKTDMLLASAVLNPASCL